MDRYFWVTIGITVRKIGLVDAAMKRHVTDQTACDSGSLSSKNKYQILSISHLL